jgi:hypothetical protein
MTDNAGYFATSFVPNFYANNAVNLNANEFANRSRPDGGRAYARVGLSSRLRPGTHAGSNNPVYSAANVPVSFRMNFPARFAVSLRGREGKRKGRLAPPLVSLSLGHDPKSSRDSGHVPRRAISARRCCASRRQGPARKSGQERRAYFSGVSGSSVPGNLCAAMVPAAVGPP